jgi:predicted alpha/beta hydrolase family esterase
VRVLSVPGAAPGPTLWLSLWEREEGWTRVEPAAEPDAWAEALAAQVAETPPPVLLVAHAEGCLVVARAGAMPGVAGALLVAPPDAEQPMTEPEIARLGPGPLRSLPFPALVVASRSDPRCAFARAAALARAWGAGLHDAGAAGRLDAGDGLGDWPEGRGLLADLRAAAEGL